MFMEQRFGSSDSPLRSRKTVGEIPDIRDLSHIRKRFLRGSVSTIGSADGGSTRVCVASVSFPSYWIV